MHRRILVYGKACFDVHAVVFVHFWVGWCRRVRYWNLFIYLLLSSAVPFLNPSLLAKAGTMGKLIVDYTFGRGG